MPEMVRKTKVAISYSAFGKKVKKPFKVQYSWDAYKTFADVKEAKAELSEKGHLKAVNAAEQAKARAEALTAAYTAAGYVKDTAATSEQIRLKDMFKTLMLSKAPDGSPKYTEQRAREIAAELVGAEWESDDVEEEEEEETEEGEAEAENENTEQKS